MAIICIIFFGAGLVFFALGAWPVVAFFGLEVGLIYIAFLSSYRSGRLVEKIQLGQKELVIIRQFPNGQVQEWRFVPYWVRVTLEISSFHDSHLVLSSHGHQVSLGKFITVEERQELAIALRNALTRWRE